MKINPSNDIKWKCGAGELLLYGTHHVTLANKISWMNEPIYLTSTTHTRIQTRTHTHTVFKDRFEKKKERETEREKKLMPTEMIKNTEPS